MESQMPTTIQLSAATESIALHIARHVVKYKLKEQGVKLSSVRGSDISIATQEIYKSYRDYFIYQAKRVEALYDEACHN
jgi:1,2-phenylacetyl-CoA epoxidase PaaB subunit